jgi:hypothetical protein
MKKMKKILILITILFISATSFSQGLFTVSYTMSFTSGDAADFISKASFRGISFDGRAFVSDNISVGGFVNWTTFYEKMPEATYMDEFTSITGTQYRYINSAPILLNAHYYTGTSDDTKRFYGGVGIGTYYIRETIEMGIWSQTEDLWHFGFAPEVGILLPVGAGVNLNVSAKWNYALKTSDSINYNWFGLNVGIAWGQ